MINLWFGNGADDYIVKPFNSRELVSRVRNTLVRIERNRFANPLTGLSGNIRFKLNLTTGSQITGR